MPFIGKKYLLGSECAERIYGKIEGLPIIDPHNHAIVSEIASNGNYGNPWQFFIGTDHYIWSLLRKFSVEERYITGTASPEEKWNRLAGVFPHMAGNPVYEWMHLELRRFMGIEELLGPSTGRMIWEKTCRLLKEPGYRPQALLGRLGVEVMCSSDDPVDLLDDHDKVNSAMGRILVHPTWRADRVVSVSAPWWPDYVRQLSERFGADASSLQGLLDNLQRSHDYFALHGCLASDHSMRIPFHCVSERKQADRIFTRVYSGQAATEEEKGILADFIFSQLAEMDSSRNWVFQMHLGVVRDTRNSLFDSFGPDAGCDVSDHSADMLPPLKSFLNRFDGRLKVILYCLDFVYQATFATLSRAFGPNVRLGAAWWFCDTPFGMKRQLEYMSSVDLLHFYPGMVSDSRRILAYGSRFEMFRRVLSDVLGNMVEKGRVPEEIASEIAGRICYSGPREFFGL